ncbi:TetR/AcrR family transcriptional regulator [Streptomyces sp. NPDC102462]|uniref:TetR/AcrR family transcriptional regulator n=1 Tax=Streptomyces sp. NPDC102462 TaxID=3366178 RepID=UPI0038054D2F
MASPLDPGSDQALSGLPGAVSGSLTERRKAETRAEIARAAARLFAGQGLRATRAEDIAQAAGIAPRTFYRYFATKEEAVAPLYAAGAQRWAEAVRTAPADLPLPAALEHATRYVLTPGSGVSAASWEWVRTLVRLADTSPALRRVWAEVCQTAERTLADVLASRLRPPTTAAGPDGPGAGPASGPDGPGAGPASGPDGPGAGPDASGGVVSPELQFGAAVASAAVRVAVESWAAGSAAATGEEGPAALALRNLAALHGFPWPST